MVFVDWVIVAGYCLFALGVGVVLSRRAGKSTTNFFVGGRAFPWWIAGTSMVATTFAADTPLGVTEVVRQGGIAGNWIWWNQLLGGMLAVFLFARLWRRAGVLTDVELVKLRYSGRGASVLRGLKAFYFAFLYNCVVMGWVITAMVTILNVTAQIETAVALPICIGIALTYSVLSGFVGVVLTDLVQFVLAIGGAIAFAALAVNYVGGIDGLEKGLAETGRAEYVNFLPHSKENPETGDTVWVTGKKTFTWQYFLVAFGMIWWAAHNADGGGYIIQRMLSCKDERHALLATLWFNIANYAVRWWPWIMVGLVSLVLFSDVQDKQTLIDRGVPEADAQEQAKAHEKSKYVDTMVHKDPVTGRPIVPPILMGLLFASFLAAFMSTIDTHLNWGTSLFVNDIYRAFWVKDKPEAHYVAASRVFMVVMMALGAGVSLITHSISDAWRLLLTMGSGLGIVLIVRWFWWRINAWSEVTAMLSSLGTMLVLKFAFDIAPTKLTVAMPLVVGVSLLTTLIVTFLTRPTNREQLKTFYRKVQPASVGWRPVVDELDPSELRPQRGLRAQLLDWAAGAAMVYCAMFAIGHIIFGRYGAGAGFAVAAIACAAFLWWHLGKANWQFAE